MKLFTKYNRVNITATIFTFVLGSIAFYFVLHYVLIRQLDETLRSEQQEIQEFIKVHHQLPEIQNTKHQWITIEKATAPLPQRKIVSNLVYDKKEDENDLVRQLTFSLLVGQEYYTVTVNKSEAETEDLLKLIILVTVAMIGLILLINYIINRKVVNRLWRPFYTTINSIRDYQIAVKQPLRLATEPIDEITLLNESLNAMTLRVYNDYHALKSFTENASHEMQTPLAVIRSKVEMLLQNLKLNEDGMKQLLVIEDATQKLSKLHQSLLLLTKIENNQFVLNEQVSLTSVIENKIEEKQDLIVSKGIILHQHFSQVTVSFHYHLAEILINNLLNNAIRYTPAGGEISIELNDKNLAIKNPAANGALDAGRVFQRFYKPLQGQEGTGLGLAIIKEICKVAGYRVTYSFENNQHQFTIHLTK